MSFSMSSEVEDMTGEHVPTVEEMKSRGKRHAKTVVRATGKAIETGVRISEKVAKGAAPVAKKLYEETKKGAKKAKEETLKAAKSMEKW